MLDKPDVSRVLAGEARTGRTRRRVIIGAVIVGVALLAGGWFWWSAAGRTSATQYLSDLVKRGDIVVTLVATGTLQPTRQIDVSSTTAGTVASVDVDYNQSVVRGQALAHLDMRDLETQLARSQAMVEVQKASSLSAEASLADANAALKRASALAESNGVSQRDLDLAGTAVRRAEASAAAAHAQVLAAEADLRAARNDYDRGVIAAPIDGVVLSHQSSIRGRASARRRSAQPLFTVASDLRQLDLEVDIDEADVAQVAQGEHGEIYGRVVAGPTLHRHDPADPLGADGRRRGGELQGAGRGRQCVDLVLKPGMTATADIEIDRAVGVLTIPNAALRFSPSGDAKGPFAAVTPKSTITTVKAGDEQTVWVLDGGKAKPVPVVTGLTDGQRTQIVSGALKDGDVVITGNKAPLR